MNKLIQFLFLVCMLCITSCDKDNNVLENANEECLVSLKLTGDISYDIVPLTRTFSSDDLIGVYVYEYSNNTYRKHSSAFFDGLSDVQLTLKKGMTYRLDVSVVKMGKKVLYNWNRFVYRPFKNSTSLAIGSQSYSLWSDDEFYSGQAHLATENNSNGYELRNYPEIIRYYGSKTATVNTDSTTIPIELKHTGFGLKYSVSGLSDGYLNLEFYVLPNYDLIIDRSISTDTESNVRYFSFNDIRSAYNSASTYEENVYIRGEWVRGNGISQSLGIKSIRVKRNTVTVVNISVSSDKMDKQIGFDIESESWSGERVENINM